jgi:type IV secretion system protein VirD4
MSATKILWGQLLFASVVVLAFLWAATEWTAWRLAFQPQLGPAWFVIGHWPVYQPLAFFIWWFKFDAYAPRIFIEGAGIAASGGIAALAVAIILSVCRAKEAQNVTTYGSARWADIKEVRRSGLLGPDGSCLVVLVAVISGMMVRNMCCVLRRRGPGRASVWSSQPC